MATPNRRLFLSAAGAASLAAVLSAVGQEGALVLVPTGQEAPAEKAS